VQHLRARTPTASRGIGACVRVACRRAQACGAHRAARRGAHHRHTCMFAAWLVLPLASSLRKERVLAPPGRLLMKGAMSTPCDVGGVVARMLDGARAQGTVGCAQQLHQRSASCASSARAAHMCGNETMCGNDTCMQRARSTHVWQRGLVVLHATLPTSTRRPSSADTLTASGSITTSSRPSPGTLLYTPASSACGVARGGGAHTACTFVHCCVCVADAAPRDCAPRQRRNPTHGSLVMCAVTRRHALHTPAAAWICRGSRRRQ
jgi:hypothetical protein